MNDELKNEAVARSTRHQDHPTHRPLSQDYELIGLAGEAAWSDRFGGQVDLTARPGGDKGKDFTISLWTGASWEAFTVDLKTACKPNYLAVEKGKCKRLTIYVLAKFHEETKVATLIGWEWGETLLKAEPRTLPGHKVLNHLVHNTRLRNLDEIEARRRKE